MLITDKITTFIRKSQLKIAEIALYTANDLDSSFTEDEDIKLSNELISAVETLQDTLLDWSAKDTEIFIDYYMTVAGLNDIAIVDITNKQTLITLSDAENSSNSWEAPLNSLNDKVDQHYTHFTDEVSRLDGRIDTLDFSNLVPQELIDAVDANTAASHTHTNKSVLDQVEQSDLDSIDLNNAHRANTSIHVTSAEKITWTTKVSQAELTAGLATKANVSHIHAISDVTGLQEAFDGLTPQKGDPGEDGESPVLQAGTISDGEFSVVIDNTDPLSPILNFTIPAGQDGRDLHIDEAVDSGDRLNSTYDNVDDGYTVLGLDNGLLYFRRTYDDAGTFIPATSASGWTSVKFTGNNGWSPIIGINNVSDTVAVLMLRGWTGGEGDYPTIGLDTTLYLSTTGFTPFIEEAINVKGPIGPTGATGKAVFPDASGLLEDRDTYDDELKDFMYYVPDSGLMYIKRSDSVGDWSIGYRWKGDTGPQGPVGPAGVGADPWNIVVTSSDVNPAVKRTIYLVDSSAAPVTVYLPDPVAGNTDEYSIVMTGVQHKVKVTTVSLVPNAVNGDTQIYIPNQGGRLKIQCNGSLGYLIVDDSRFMHTIELITTDRDFTTDGFEHSASYKINPAVFGGSVLLTLPVPKSYDKDHAIRASFTLTGDGSFTVIRSDSGLIGNSTQQVVSSVGATITIEEGEGKYNIVQDSRPTGSSILSYPFYRLSDVSDIGGIYYSLSQSKTDPRYGTELELLSGAITSTTPVNYANYITDSDVDLGTIPASNVNFVVSTKKVVDTTAHVIAYYEIYKRDSIGTETLITTTPNFIITQIAYSQFNITGQMPETVFSAGDRLLIKVWLAKSSTSPANPELSTKIEGDNGAFFIVQLPSVDAKHNNLQGRDESNTHPAQAISYDNTVSGLVSENVKDAIDELESNFTTLETSLDAPIDGFAYSKVNNVWTKTKSVGFSYIYTFTQSDLQADINSRIAPLADDLDGALLTLKFNVDSSWSLGDTFQAIDLSRFCNGRILIIASTTSGAKPILYNNGTGFIFKLPYSIPVTIDRIDFRHPSGFYYGKFIKNYSPNLNILDCDFNSNLSTDFSSSGWGAIEHHGDILKFSSTTFSKAPGMTGTALVNILQSTHAMPTISFVACSNGTNKYDYFVTGVEPAIIVTDSESFVTGTVETPSTQKVLNFKNLVPSGTTGQILYNNSGAWTILPVGSAGQVLQTNGAAAPTWEYSKYDFGIALSDETSDLTTDNDLGGYFITRNQVIENIYLYCATAPTGQNLICLIKKNGTTIATATIIAGTNYINVVSGSISDTSLNVTDIITADVTQVGSTVAGTGLKLYFNTHLA